MSIAAKLPCSPKQHRITPKTMGTEDAAASHNLDRDALSTIALNKTLRQNASDLYVVPLQRLNCSFDIVRAEERQDSLRAIVRHQARKTKADVVILYAVRHPGCPSCREHASQLVTLSQNSRRVLLMGVVKETENNDALEFYQDYFGRNALYKDDKWKVFKAMGNKRLGLKQALVGYFSSRRRFREKNIEVGKSPGGDAWLQGGMMMFDRSGDLHFAYNEDFKEFDMELIGHALTETRLRYRSKKHGSKETSVSSTMDGSESSHW